VGWSAIIGSRKVDKTQAALVVARRLREHGLTVGGFVQREVLAPSGDVVGWDVVRVDGAARRVLARTSPTPELCDYRFDAAGFAQAAACALEPCEVVLVGSVGKLEADRQGHFPVLERLARAPCGPHVLAVVRDSCLTQVGLALPDASGWVELPCDDAALERFADELAARVRAPA
jgi:nucleoside-triphosphatase THEP1